MIALREERGCGCVWCARVCMVGVCNVEVMVSHSKGAIIISLGGWSFIIALTICTL